MLKYEVERQPPRAGQGGARSPARCIIFPFTEKQRCKKRCIHHLLLCAYNLLSAALVDLCVLFV